MGVRTSPSRTDIDTDERPTGRTFNGKLTYVKAFPLESLPAGDTVIEHGIVTLCTVVQVGGSVTNSIPVGGELIVLGGP